jgi:hypothetical protein
MKFDRCHPECYINIDVLIPSNLLALILLCFRRNKYVYIELRKAGRIWYSKRILIFPIVCYVLQGPPFKQRTEISRNLIEAFYEIIYKPNTFSNWIIGIKQK